MFRLTTFVLDGWPVNRKYCRASFHADSTASDPPVVKKTRLRSPGVRLAIRSARSIARGCAYVHSGKYASSDACFDAASASSVRPWPIWLVKSPARPSR